MKCVEFNKDGLEKSIKILKDGGIIAHPADTCYGLAGDFTNKRALEKIQAIKGRDGKKPMSIMFPVYMKPDIGEYAEMDDFAHFVCFELLPGPVTILLPKGKKIPDFYFPDSPYVGVRIPYDMGTEDILTKFRGPLITTSANVSSQPPCATCQEVCKIFDNHKNKPDLVFDGAIRNACLPSTVMLVENKKIKIIREGPMTKSQIEGVLGVKVR